MVLKSSKKFNSELAKDASVALLQLAKELSPIFPPLQAGVSAALWIVETADGFKSNKEEWEKLSLHLAGCLSDIAKALEGKAPNDVVADLEPLNRTLTSVQSSMAVLAKRSLIARIAQSREDLKLIRRFKEDMDASISRFSMTSHLAIRQRLMDDVKPTLKLNFASITPPKPSIFHGREAELNAILDLVERESNRGSSAKVVVLGSGGLGKTSLALYALHDARMKSRFGQSTYFVSCEAIESGGLFISALVQTLKLPNNSEDPFQQLLLFLTTHSDPLLLILDNFETPWYGSDQKNVQKVLEHLGSLDNVTLMLTMRGLERPQGVAWSRPPLPPLSPLTLDAARETFLTIASELAPSEELDDLLRSIDCVPLAVTLMANVSLTVDSIESLQRDWAREKTSLMNANESNRHTNIELSIKLSIDCLPMKSNPASLRFLSLLALLPDGALLDKVNQLSTMDNIHTAMRVLKRIGLAYDAPSRLKVLSPIRAYVQKYYPPEEADLTMLMNHYVELATLGQAWPGNDNWEEACSVLIPESGNLHSVLPLAIKGRGTEIIAKSVLSYAGFLSLTTPNHDIVKLLAERVDGWDVSKELKAKCLEKYGDLLSRTAKYAEAEAILKRARELSISCGSTLRAAYCLNTLGSVYRHWSKPDLSVSTLEQARLEFEAIDASTRGLGLAECLQALAGAKLARDDNDQIVELYEQAREIYQSKGERIMSAECLRGIGYYYVFPSRSQFDIGLPLLEEALSELQATGYFQGEASCIWIIGNTLAVSGRVDEALEILPRALTLLLRVGDQTVTGRCCQSLGICYSMKQSLTEAEDHLRKAIAIFQKLGYEPDIADCLQYLANAYTSGGDFPKIESAYKTARDEYLRLGNKSNAAACLKDQAMYCGLQGKHHEALIMHLRAREELLAVGDQHKAAMALMNSGNTLSSLMRFPEAWNAFRTARIEFDQFPTNSIQFSDMCKKMQEMFQRNLPTPFPLSIDELIDIEPAST